MRWVKSILLVPLIIAGPQPSFAQKPAIPKAVPRYPNDVALTEEGGQGYIYRQSKTSLRLYTNDRDAAGQSTCTDMCASAWPILPVSAKEKPVGDWSIITRGDGQKQWAFKGKPVYLRFHDAPGEPTGDGVDGVWHIIAQIPLR